jgi:3-deoxy-D-manno-octulosonic acid kinase
MTAQSQRWHWRTDATAQLYLPPSATQITSQWFDAGFWSAQHAISGVVEGRGTTYFITHDHQQMVLRRYLRGGAIRHLSHDQFLFSGLKRTRVACEIDILRYCATQGLNVPRPIAGVVWRRGLTYQNAVLLERIPDAHDVHSLLLSSPLGEQTWHDIGRIIRQLHEIGVYHHDLNIHNILLDSQQQLWLIDFDRCYRRLPGKWTDANLNRLLRSLRKEQANADEYYFAEYDWDCLLDGYHYN